MMRRVIGLLLILRALSPFLWLLAAWLLVGAIGERFGQVSGRYATEFDVQLELYDELAERIGAQIEAIEPAIQAAAAKVRREFEATLLYLAGTIAQLKALPPIDLSGIMPELHFPTIRLPDITLNWNIPSVPIVQQVAEGIRDAVQGVANSVNAVFDRLTGAIGTAFEQALAPLRNELVANVMRQLGPYIAAYRRVSASLAAVGGAYDVLAGQLGELQRQLAAVSGEWERIVDDLGEQIGLSVTLVETMPQGLGLAIDQSLELLLLFGLFTLALFLVFYWAAMLRDLQQGWALLTNRYEAWKRQQETAPPRPLVERWIARADAARAARE